MIFVFSMCGSSCHNVTESMLQKNTILNFKTARCNVPSQFRTPINALQSVELYYFISVVKFKTNWWLIRWGTRLVCNCQHWECLFSELLVAAELENITTISSSLWAIPQYPGHLRREVLIFWQKPLRTIHTYHLVPFKLPKNVQRGLFQGLLVF